ncbi:MAG: hypothetical protein U0903_18030 [Planctomycetales bacterium]
MTRPALLLAAACFLSLSLSAERNLVAAQRFGGHFVGRPAHPPVFLNERSVQFQHRINADLLYPRGEFVPKGVIKRRPPDNPTLGYPNYY